MKGRRGNIQKMVKKPDYFFKIILLGSRTVGKTSLVRRFADDKFDENYIPTLGVDITSKNLTMNDGTKITLICVDPGSHDYFGRLRRSYYQGVRGALLIFDLTNLQSFEDMPKWIEELNVATSTDVPIICVGNKNDLVEERKISIEQINARIQRTDPLKTFFETSAKTGDNVKEVYHRLTKEILNKQPFLNET